MAATHSLNGLNALRSNFHRISIDCRAFNPFETVPNTQKYWQYSHKIPHAKLMRMFDVCVEMPSTSKNYHGFFSGQIFQACGYHISLDQKCFFI